MRIALTRQVSSGLTQCELTYLPRTEIDVERAQAQHLAYEQSLSSLGCAVKSLRAEPHLPDSVFIEDTAVVLDELAVITRPGAASRRAETSPVAKALEGYRTLAHIEAPGALDGGDVLRIGKRIWVGVSGRTNASGVQQLRDAVAPHGYAVQGVTVRGCLHLKSAVTQIAEDTILMNPEWVDANCFSHLRAVNVASSEPMSGNALLIGDAVIYPSAFPETRGRMEALGIRIISVDVSELAKAEGGVTCCSLIFEG